VGGDGIASLFVPRELLVSGPSQDNQRAHKPWDGPT
jgi:hypothetical protein